jgi:hypothetical protein
VPGLRDSLDTDATLANAASDTPLADTRNYSNGLERTTAKTNTRSPSTGIASCLTAGQP